MQPNRYALRHGCDARTHRLQNWRLEGRNAESEGWTALRTQAADDSINAPAHGFGMGCWNVEGQKGLGFRYLRILITGLNSSGHNFLFCTGLEFWGTLTDATPA